jgi:hypothetical protein
MIQERKKVLNDFLWVIINKRKRLSNGCSDKIKVNWRYSGTELITIINA